jgi:hypothetical protein
MPSLLRLFSQASLIYSGLERTFWTRSGVYWRPNLVAIKMSDLLPDRLNYSPIVSLFNVGVDVGRIPEALASFPRTIQDSKLAVA